jgi:CBS domain-containing protein
MNNSLTKLLNSNGTLILIGIVTIPYLTYLLYTNNNPVKKVIVHVTTSTKTLEEIMTYSPAAVSDQPWDTEFKSAIIPIKEGE